MSIGPVPACPGEQEQRRTGELLRASEAAHGDVRRHVGPQFLHQRGLMNQRDLGYAVGMDKAMIVRVVDDLEKAELALRNSVPGDRRVREVGITDRGTRMFDQAHDNGKPISEALTGHLAPEERAQLMDLLTRFTYPPPD